MLFLPETDGKYCHRCQISLEPFRLLMDPALGDADRRQAEQQFRIDIRKHVQDIAENILFQAKQPMVRSCLSLLKPSLQKFIHTIQILSKLLIAQNLVSLANHYDGDINHRALS